MTPQCDDGWCRIPAGCFIWGSPESEPGRGFADEQQGPVTLTHDFEMKQYEMTIDEWTALAFPPDPSPPVHDCQNDSCPVTNMSWSHALLFANAQSQAHKPPLEPCYILEGCRTYRGNYTCGCLPNEPLDCPGWLGMTKETVYGCEGYRLPTRAEWQYAARAGTDTAFYSGDITVTYEQEGNAESCAELREPALDPIAWYCVNSGDVSHPVGGKLKNAWGLYDMIGNAYEMLHDVERARSPDFPAIDPFGEIGEPRDGRPFVGGAAISPPSLLRIASGLQMGAGLGSALTGFRLARTLGPGQVPTLDDIPDASATE